MVILLGLLGLTGALAAPPARFGYEGVAPLLAGTSLAQAEKQLGTRLQPAAGSNAAACRRYDVPAWPGVQVIVDNAVISRVETRDKRYASISGVHVGDDVAKVRRVYGQRLSVSPHLYFANGLTLAVYSPDRRFALIMESNDAGRIITLRAGAVPAVEHLEGCSR